MVDRLRSRVFSWMWRLLLAFGFITSAAAQTVQLHGYVIDANTKSPIEGAEVSVVGDSRTAPFPTDTDGAFKLEVQKVSPDGTVVLRVTKSGYQTLQRIEGAAGGEAIRVELHPI